MRSILVKLTVVAAASLAVFLLLATALVRPGRVQAAVSAPNPGVAQDRLGRVKFGEPDWRGCLSPPSTLPVPQLFLAEDRIWVVLTIFSLGDRGAVRDSDKHLWELLNINKEYDWKATGQVLAEVRQQIQEWKDEHPGQPSIVNGRPINMVVAAEENVRYGDLIKAMDLVVVHNFDGFRISEGSLETLAFFEPQPFEGW